MTALASCVFVVMLTVLADAKLQVEQTIPTVSVISVVGGSVDLPCDVNPPSSDDRILLVLWYREGLGTPIYSFDARKHSLDEGRHWSDAEVLSSRSHFRLGINGDATARLILADVRASDQGSYRCRVDFKLSPTRNSRVNLTIVVPPQTPIIFDENGVEVKTIAGPYDEEGVLVLTCEASGGKPFPKVTWWRESRLLDSKSENVVQGRVRNTLRISNLNRSDIGMTLTCQASNNNVSVPASTATVVDMKLKPLGLELVGENRPYSADRKYEFTCRSWGARPSATITWWKGSTRLQSSKQTVSPDGNMTTSVLTYIPSLEDQGKVLSCRVEHSLLAHNALEQGWKLNIQYVPVTQLEMAGSLQMDNIKEGDDVYLECNIRAFPWITNIIWRYNGQQIHQNVTEGIIIHNHTLVIQNVQRHWAGIYTCVASNDEGDGESNAIALHVRFFPVCKSGQITTYHVARGELIQVPCEIEAYPTDLIFHWSFNGSRDFADIPGSNYVADRLKSALSYRPVTDQDYGTLMCWAQNTVGEQRQPCIFQVVPADKPESVSNCSSGNITTDTVEINCTAGYDGGLMQQFFVEVANSHGKLVTNRTSHVASFRVRDLQMGRNYEITVWAFNSKGRSSPQVIHVATAFEPVVKDKKTIGQEPIVASNAVAPSTSASPPTYPLPLQLTPVLGSLIGIGTALILAALIIVLIMRFRDTDRHNRRSTATDYDKAAVPLHVDADESFDLKDKKSRIETDTRDEEERAFDKILSMSTSKRMLVSPSKSGTLKNGPVSNVTWTADSSTIYGQMDQGKRHSVTAVVPLNSSMAAMSPPSGYVRLPPVDHFHLIPYADTSSSSPSPSQYSAQTQQVRWSRGEPETISVDSREMKMTGTSTQIQKPIPDIEANVPTSNWVSPVGTTRL